MRSLTQLSMNRNTIAQLRGQEETRKTKGQIESNNSTPPRDKARGHREQPVRKQTPAWPMHVYKTLFLAVEAGKIHTKKKKERKFQDIAELIHNSTSMTGYRKKEGHVPRQNQRHTTRKTDKLALEI